MEDDSAAGAPAETPADPGKDETMLSGTPAFEALFAALEHVPPAGDAVTSALLTGSSLASFG